MFTLTIIIATLPGEVLTQQKINKIRCLQKQAAGKCNFE